MVAVAILLGLLLAANLPGVQAGPTPPSQTTAPVTAFQLAPAAGAGTLPGSIWGANYDYGGTGWENSTLAAIVNTTPITFLRLPTSGSFSTIYRLAYTFCTWVKCKAEITVGGPGTSPAKAASDVKYLENTLHIHPEYWAYGNEPNLWKFSWNTSGTPTPRQYAFDVRAFIQDVQKFDTKSHFSAPEIAGTPHLTIPYVQNVTAVDAKLLTAISIQDYPGRTGVQGNVEQDFMNNLNDTNSIRRSAGFAWGAIHSVCSCAWLHVEVHEFNAGPSFKTPYQPYQQGFDEVPFYVASIVQGLTSNVSDIAFWTLANTVASGECAFTIVELDGYCNGVVAKFNPIYYFLSQMAKRLPIGGNLTNLTLGGLSSVYGIEDASAGTRWLLLANTNLTNTLHFRLSSRFGAYLADVVGYQMVKAYPDTVKHWVHNTSKYPTFALPPDSVMLLELQ